VRPFKGIICDDISEFESHMPSQPVGPASQSGLYAPRFLARAIYGLFADLDPPQNFALRTDESSVNERQMVWRSGRALQE
jgi:hypothetical protein